MEGEVNVVTVIRDPGMYAQCIRDNAFLAGCRLVPVDNRQENRPIPDCYNAFLDSDPAGWLVFCHEDWEVLEPLLPRLQHLDPGRIYGPVGVFLEEHPFRDHLLMRGGVRQCDKDGGHPAVVRGLEPEGRVDTLDCQCLIVHASLIRSHHLRFDPRLPFDMYAEDFCVAAYEQAGIQSCAITLDCMHHSSGHISRPFRRALRIVRSKYAASTKRYATIVGHNNTFGAHPCKPVCKIKKK